MVFIPKLLTDTFLTGRFKFFHLESTLLLKLLNLSTKKSFFKFYNCALFLMPAISRPVVSRQALIFLFHLPSLQKKAVRKVKAN